MTTKEIHADFYTLVENINYNVITYIDVMVNNNKEVIVLVFKNNLHTKSGKILKISSLDQDFDKIRLIKEINFKK